VLVTREQSGIRFAPTRPCTMSGEANLIPNRWEDREHPSSDISHLALA